MSETRSFMVTVLAEAKEPLGLLSSLRFFNGLNGYIVPTVVEWNTRAFIDERDKLRAENAELRKDAERYRFMREDGDGWTDPQLGEKTMSWSIHPEIKSVSAGEAHAMIEAQPLPQTIKDYIGLGINGLAIRHGMEVKVTVTGSGHLCDGPGSYDVTTATIRVERG